MVNAVVIFAGQGATPTWLPKELVQAYPRATEMYEEVHDHIAGKPTRVHEKQWLAHPEILEVLDPKFSLNEETLSDTKYQQLAIYTSSAIMYKILNEELANNGMSLEVLATGGHSLGEFTALPVKRLCDWKDAAYIVAVRGTLMSQYGKGALASAGDMETQTLETLLNKGFQGNAVIAINNGRTYNTIGGDRKSVEEAVESINHFRGKARILPVSGAFHTVLMNEANEHFNEFLDSIGIFLLGLGSDRVMLYQNATGGPSYSRISVLQNLGRHMTARAEFYRQLKNMVSHATSGSVVLDIGVGAGPKRKSMIGRFISDAMVYEGIADMVKLISIAQPSDIAKAVEGIMELY